MAKYRKKPVEINAIRNDGEWKPIMDWLDNLNGAPVRIPFDQRPTIDKNGDGTLNIRTLEGTMRAEVGDWIICGIQGEFYPCKPEIFEATYDPMT